MNHGPGCSRGLIWSLPTAGRRQGSPTACRVIRLFRGAIERAKLPCMRFHDLRHTHATLGLEAGIPVKAISQCLGHSSTRITQDVYQHVLREQQEAAAAQIADLVKLAGSPASAPDEGAK